MISSFLAFDTETATPSGELCSIAVVRFDAGVPTQEWHTLVNPQVPIWSRFTDIHGISNRDVARAPSFAQLWDEWQQHFLGALPVVAHNASFDLGVLKTNLRLDGLELPSFPLHCTVKMARRLYPELANHKLNTVAAHLNIALNHHDALSDALACGQIASAALKTWGKF